MKNTYEILAKFIQPSLSEDLKEKLLALIRSGGIDWNSLLLQANQQLVTPLWYLCLKRNDLLKEVPQDLADYLRELFVANSERNNEFFVALNNLVETFCAVEILPMLLKGGTALVSQVYDDPGARIIGDIDLLIPEEDIHKTPEVLSKLGYTWSEKARSEWMEGPLASNRHFPRAFLKDSLVVTEIHYKVLSREGDVGFDARDFIGRGSPVALDGATVLIPELTDRLIHNAVHALSTERAWQTSTLSLRDLSEWVYLYDKGKEDFDSDHWNAFCSRSRWRKPLATYVGLACNLFEIAPPKGIDVCDDTSWQRFLPGGSISKRIDRKLRPFISYPIWLWHNNRYAIPGVSNRDKLVYLGKSILNIKSWKMIYKHWVD